MITVDEAKYNHESTGIKHKKSPHLNENSFHKDSNKNITE